MSALDEMVKFLSDLLAAVESGDVTPEEAGIYIRLQYPPVTIEDGTP